MDPDRASPGCPTTAVSVLHAVAAGEPDAIAACMQRFRGPVQQLARRLLPDRHDREDAVQEIFLDLWRSAERFDPRVGSELAFVLTIARRRLIDRARRRQRVPAAAEDLSHVESTPEPDVVAQRDASDRVVRAMAELRPEQRAVLEQAFLAGRTHQEIASETGMALGTVKSHARRGLMRLRERLGLSQLGLSPADEDPSRTPTTLDAQQPNRTSTPPVTPSSHPT